MAEPEPRSRPARVRRRRVLICAPGRVVNGPAPRGLFTLIRPVHVSVDRLTAALCRPRMPLSRAGSRHARRLLMCPVPSGSGEGGV
jgi:hypothetical protein